MFEAETRKLLLSFDTAANKENQDAIIKESMQEFVNLRHQNPGTLLGLYYLIMQSYGREGNADYYSYERPQTGNSSSKNLRSLKLVILLWWMGLLFLSQCAGSVIGCSIVR